MAAALVRVARSGPRQTVRRSLSLDAATGHYLYVWKTDSTWTGCRELMLKLLDGEEYRATFTLRK